MKKVVKGAALFLAAVISFNSAFCVDAVRAYDGEDAFLCEEEAFPEEELLIEEALDEDLGDVSENDSDDSSEESAEGEEELLVEEETAIPVTLTATSATSGSCGKEATWTYNTVTKEVVISGKGPMTDYTSGNPAPWLAYADEIRTVTISDGITKIGGRSFLYLKEVTKINIAASVTTIGELAFYRCLNEAPGSDGECELILPEGVKDIYSSAFSGCSNMKIDAGKFPSSLEYIGYCAFYHDKQLTGDLKLGKNMKSLGGQAFEGSGLNGAVEIPGSIKEVSERAFAETKITSIKLAEGIEVLGWRAFYGCGYLDLGDFIFPKSLTSIEEQCFSNLKATNLTFGTKFKNFGSISGEPVKNTNGDKYDVPDKLTVVFKGDMPTFTAESAITDFDVVVYYPKDNKTWTKSKIKEASKKFDYVRWFKEGESEEGSQNKNIKWSYDAKIKTLTIKGKGEMDNYITYHPAPWDECSSEAEIIVIEDGIESIGDYAFNAFKKAKKVSIGNTVSYIGKNCFRNTNLDELVFPKSLEKISSEAFDSGVVRQVIFTGNPPVVEAPVTGLGFWSNLVIRYPSNNPKWDIKTLEEFNNNYGRPTSIRFYPLEKGVTNKCGDNITWSFVKKEGRRIIVLEGSGEMYDFSIGECAPWFVHEDYRYVKYGLTIGSGITYIGENSFEGMSIESGEVRIPATVKKVGKKAFNNFGGYDTTLVVASGTKLEYVGDRAFSYMSVGSTTFQAAIRDAKEVGEGAFVRSSRLGLENLSVNIENIGDDAFYNCKIKNLSFGDKCRSIGEEAFADNQTLTSVDFGKAVQNIGSYAFRRCVVDEVVIPDSVTETGYDVIPDFRKKLTVGKNIKHISALGVSLKADKEIYFTGDYIDMTPIRDNRHTIYYPVGNASWDNGICELGDTKLTFIPYGDLTNSEYTVRFFTNCETKVKDQVVKYGNKVMLPLIKNNDHAFEGWYTDRYFTSEFDVNTKVYCNLNLYAKWSGVSEDWGDVSEEDRKEGNIISPMGIPSGLWCAGVKSEAVYCGKAITLSKLHVYYGKKRLKTDKEYSVKYKNNTKPGTATAVITLKGKRKDSKTVSFNIVKVDFGKLPEGETVKYSNVSYKLKYDKEVFVRYTGKPIKKKPTFKLYRNGKAVTLKEKRDFVYDYSESDFTSEGQHKILIKGCGNYSGSFEITEEIKSLKDISKVTVTGVKSKKATGEAITFDKLTVKYGKTVLKNGSDYELKYKNNVEPGTATILICGKGDYAGYKKVTFKITAVSISSWVVTGVKNSYGYDINGVVPENIVVYPNKTAAKKAADPISPENYSIEYINNMKPGTGTVVIKGKGKYRGTKKISFKIIGSSFKGLKLFGLDGIEYTGDAIDPRELPDVVVGYSPNHYFTPFQYEVTATNNVNAGTATATVRGLKNFYGTKQYSFTIAPFTVTEKNTSISGTDLFNSKRVRVKLSDSYKLTNGQCSPEPDVYFRTKKGDIKHLKNGVDYTVSYSNNTAAGTGQIIITFKGNYTGQLTHEFKIK